jgi:hypothetical protein
MRDAQTKPDRDKKFCRQFHDGRMMHRLLEPVVQISILGQASRTGLRVEGSSEKAGGRRPPREGPREKVSRRRLRGEGLPEKTKGRRSPGEGQQEKAGGRSPSEGRREKASWRRPMGEGLPAKAG